MKKISRMLRIVGILLIVAGGAYFTFAHMITDPEVEGEAGRASTGSGLSSLIPVALGILLVALSWVMKKKKTSA